MLQANSGGVSDVPPVSFGLSHWKRRVRLRDIRQDSTLTRLDGELEMRTWWIVRLTHLKNRIR